MGSPVTRGAEFSSEARPRLITFVLAAFQVMESAVFSLFVTLVEGGGADEGVEEERSFLLPFLPKNLEKNPLDLEA
jgi:hypothetical protein